MKLDESVNSVMRFCGSISNEGPYKFSILLLLLLLMKTFPTFVKVQLTNAILKCSRLMWDDSLVSFMVSVTALSRSQFWFRLRPKLENLVSVNL